MLAQSSYIKDVLKITKQYQHNKKRGHNGDPLLNNIYKNSSGRRVRSRLVGTIFLPLNHQQHQVMYNTLNAQTDSTGIEPGPSKA